MPAEIESTLPEFSGGRIVLFELARTEPGKGTIILEFIEFKNFGGRIFAVGRIPDLAAADSWLVGSQAAVAWDDVVDYIVFASREEYEKRAATYRPKRKRGMFS